MNLALIGYRGTGKSTVARVLARELKWPWVDADVELEARAGKSIQDIFAVGGEPLFRDFEAMVIADLTQGDRQVLALGGGAILREDNRAAIRERCVTAWLTASPATILARIQSDPTSGGRRPNLTTAGGLAEIETLLAARTPLYRECADCTVASDDRSPETIAAEILAAMGDRLR
jgi:shikimate kinase